MEKSVAALSTELLRTSSDLLYVRLRELLPGHGIDLERDLLADFSSDDTDQEFGVVVTTDRRVFTFVLHWGRNGDLKAKAATGTIHDWNNISEWWQASPYRRQVEEAFAILDRR